MWQQHPCCLCSRGGGIKTAGSPPAHLAAARAPVPLKVAEQLEAAALLAEADRLPLHHQARQLQVVGADLVALQE